MDEVLKIVNDIKSGDIKPIYFLMGEEPYYIDKLSDYIEKKVLSEEEKGFNQTVLYGRDITIEDIISTAKRYPMMADRQVVIVKEAQDLIRTIDKLESYADNPMPSTVLVFCYKYKTLDKRKKVTKLLAKNGIVYESKNGDTHLIITSAKHGTINFWPGTGLWMAVNQTWRRRGVHALIRYLKS